MMCAFLISCALFFGVGDIPDKSVLTGLLEAAYAPTKDLSFEYEGKMTYPQGGESEIHDVHGLFDDYSGVISERRDGAVSVDIYHRFHKRRPEIVRETIAILGERCEIYTRTVDQRGATGQVVNAHYSRPEVSGSMSRISFANTLIGLLRDGNWSVIQEGFEEISGHRCIVVKFTFILDNALMLRFWIDLERGGHALKYEMMQGKGVSMRAFNIKLEQFKDSHGQAVWIPVSGIWEAYGSIDGTVDGKGRPVIGSEPTNRETYVVLRESVRVNTGLKDDRFSVKYRAGTLITDKLRRVQYQFGQTVSPGKKITSSYDAEANLKEQLRLADLQKDELKAASGERAGATWVDWLPWAAVSGSLVLIVCIWGYRRYA
jgi:hypothetical protein